MPTATVVRRCVVCGAEFTPKRNWSGGRTYLSRATTCSKACKQSLCGPPLWTKPELEALDQLVGDVPIHLLCRQYRKWATRHGYPARTDSAIRVKANQLGSVMPSGDWLTTGAVRVLLGVGKATVDKWVRMGWIAPQRMSQLEKSRYAFRRSQFRELAEQRPWIFGGLERDSLYAMFEDWDFVDDLLSRYPRRPNTARAVMCVETGQVYESIAAAARSVYVTKGAITRALRLGKPCLGRTWRHVERRAG